MEPGMKIYGLAAASEFLQDRIVYRNLVPLDPRLPGLEDWIPILGLPPARTPRKHELDYARVVAQLLQKARTLNAPRQPIKRLVFVGDTELLDGTAFANLCRVTGWPGLAFIGDETGDAPAFRVVSIDAGEVYLANRWSSLSAFDAHCQQVAQPIDEATAVVIDLDKTILGARQRNSKVIDGSRSQAMEMTIAGLLGDGFVAENFHKTYTTFNQAEFHPFTSDNQDYLAYVCLMILGGVLEASSLAEAVRQAQIASFEQLISQIEAKKQSLPSALRQAHAEVFACVQAGDPTPFKAFRYKEYEITASAMGCLEDGATIEALLSQEITITQEVRQMALEWQNRGALIFGLSDKPAEASLPTAQLAAQGYLPLHRTLTHAVGASR